MIYTNPGQAGSVITFESRYGNYIGGEFVPPVKGEYFDNVSPVTGEVFCEIPRSSAEDIDKALDAAHAAAPHDEARRFKPSPGRPCVRPQLHGGRGGVRAALRSP